MCGPMDSCVGPWIHVWELGVCVVHEMQLCCVLSCSGVRIHHIKMAAMTP